MSAQHRTVSGRTRRAFTALCAAAGLLIAADAALAQQYRNLEVTPNGRGGASGSYGGRNFEIEPDYSRPRAGAVPGRTTGTRPANTVRVPPDNGGRTMKNCRSEGNGSPVCR